MRFYVFLLSVGLALISGLCVAQTPAAVIGRSLPALESTRTRESIESYKRDQSIQKIIQDRSETKKEAPAQKKPAPPAKEKPLLKAKEISFTPSDVFTAAELDAFKAPYLNQEMTLSDIKKLVQSINDVYEKRGFLTSKAYVPEQDVRQGVLVIGLFEGTLGAVTVSPETARTKVGYVETFLNLSPGAVLNVTDVETDILKFNAMNETKARVALEPSSKAKATNMDVVVDEPQRVSVTAFTDNAGQKETGYYRFGAFAVLRDLIPNAWIKDVLNMGGVFSRGSKAFFGSYALTEPVGGTTWTVGLDYSDTEIVGGDLRGLNITGDFYNYYASVKKVIFATANTVSTASLTGSIKNGATFVSRFKTQEVKTDTVTASVDHLWLLTRGYFYNQFSATRAMKISAGNSHFWHFNYNGEFQKGFLSAWAFNTKIRAQKSSNSLLPSSDQFQVGGVNSVRGYPEGMLVGDEGWTLMNELKYETTGAVSIPAVTRSEVFAFYDIGKAYSAQSGDLQNRNEALIYSAGVGTRVDVWDRVNASLTAAFPLKRHPYNKDRKGVKFLFNLQVAVW